MRIQIIKDVNDVIALALLLVIIPALWVLDGLKTVEFNGQVIGATILGWGNVLQYYFRKKMGEKSL